MSNRPPPGNIPPDPYFSGIIDNTKCVYNRHNRYNSIIPKRGGPQ